MQQSSSQTRPPTPAPAREVVPGIWQITLPIPFPLKNVNVYALIGPDGWAMIDAGIGVPAARAALAAGLEHIGLSTANLKALLLTHHHPDHIGLSADLYEQSGKTAAVYMHPIDEATVHYFWAANIPESFSQTTGFFRQHGMPDQNTPIYSQVDAQQMKNALRVPPHEAFTLVEDGEYVTLAGEQYRVIWTPGHADGQICLLRERDGVFISADHVLPRITPNIGLYPNSERPNPLQDYIESLHKVQSLPASIVLPGHGDTFTDLAGRTQEILDHHVQREEQISTFLQGQPNNAYQVALQLFGQRMEHGEARRMAMAETLSHLEHLRLGGRAKQHHNRNEEIVYALI